MTQYIVHVAEVHYQPVKVEADSLAEAVNLVNSGGGFDFSKPEFQYVMDLEEWEVLDGEGNIFKLMNNNWFCTTKEPSSEERKRYQASLEGLTRTGFKTKKALELLSPKNNASRMFLEHVLVEACYCIQSLRKKLKATAGPCIERKSVENTKTI